MNRDDRPMTTNTDAIEAMASTRSRAFANAFAKTTMEETKTKATNASERLRVTVLNAAIKSEASARSDVPTIVRALEGMSAKTKGAIKEYETRAREIPRMRYELLESLSEKKLALEKKIAAASAPRESARKRALKESMSAKSARDGW